MKIERKCVACGKVEDRSNFIRVTKVTGLGEIVVNPNSKTFGRSVYLCKNKICVNSAFKKDRIFKVLKTPHDALLQDKILNVIEKL